MFLRARELDHKMKILDNDFGKPVETIMQCGDFKSNFARRLSNRHIVKSSEDDAKRGSELACKLSLKSNLLESTKENVADSETANGDDLAEEKEETAEEDGCAGASQSDAVQHHHTSTSDLHNIEVSALTSQLETLRWQLKQTESNRRMIISLLEQVVSFLHKVKEHMVPWNVVQPNISDYRPASSEVTSPVVASSELLRSRSVFHVNDAEYTRTPVKKYPSKKMSKSISNVNGFHRPDPICKQNPAHDVAWRQSKQSLLETNSNKNILEELSRLITLAHTVLTTKLPHLAGCDVIGQPDAEQQTPVPPQPSPQVIEPPEGVPVDARAKEETTPTDVAFQSAFILNTSNESADFDGITNKYIEARDQSVDKYTVPPSPLTCGLEDDFASVSLDSKCNSFTTSLLYEKKKIAKREKKDPPTVGIEDESGFSSMSSFQEIGIPIINITPPTPSKEITFLSDRHNLAPTEEIWKPEIINVDKQNMKVFWV